LAGGKVPVVVGPTAVGKTAVGLALANHWPLEIISADSRQVYRRLDIGTAKPTRKERGRVPHHGLDLVEPGGRYSAGHFARDAVSWLADIRARGRLPVIVGGTGLYVRALAEGLFTEPALEPTKRRSLDAWTARLEPIELLRWASRLDPGFAGGGRQRAARAIEVALLSGHPLSYWQQVARAQGSLDPWYIVLTVPRPVLHQRIARRADEMVRRGLIEEVAAVLAEGHPPTAPGLDGIGVKEAVEYLHGQRSRETVAEAITVGTRQYAKRQQTWFRHQLRGNVTTLDATRAPEKLASEIAGLWAQAESLELGARS
jgi:tRNA dimethylallyltransferase